MKHFIEVFIHQAKTDPDNIAVTDSRGSLSYGELNRRSAYLAKLILRALGPERETGRVALLLPRTKEFITAWIAVLRAGLTVIPLSDEYPAERVAAILRDADCGLCLTAGDPVRNGAGDVPVILPDEVMPPGKEVPDQDTDLNLSRPEAEGMIFYTSGSTGNPKGVVHLARILDAYPELLPQAVPFSPDTRTLLVAMFTFAASLIDLTPPLYYGGSLYIADENERKDVKELYRIIKEHRISGTFIPPVLYGVMRRQFGPLPLRYLFLSGEKAREQNMFGDPGVFELYGASECPPMLINPLGKGGPASLGRPFEGVTAYLADDDGNRISKPEVIGELCIITPYEAVGYHNLPEETAGKFTDPEDGKGPHIYHTGDYMAFASDGSLIFHGRKDRMVKIRGQRVELGEIDHIVGRYPGITEARTVNVTFRNA
ncbi:MAG: AMP-binding protein, partial [Lachnospiraceae bacterium]|nr:AMP-binding protein [Lachnospiraceae bacterium]